MPGFPGAEVRSQLSATGKMVRETLEAILIAVLLALFIRTFVVESFLVLGNSMEPNLHNRERLFINKIVYRLREPGQGEIIVFRYPKDPGRDFVKRVIACGGDTLEIRDGTVYVNGERLAETYQPDRDYADFPAVEVGEGMIFVLGDNRDNSEDSRFFGAVPRGYIKGRALFVYWPLQRWRFL
jgi:signal peptidase I